MLARDATKDLLTNQILACPPFGQTEPSLIHENTLVVFAGNLVDTLYI